MSLHDPREFPVLYVDDEVENLRIFELTFQREFTVLTAQSAEEGMRLLNENPVALVLSDHKMPGMTGVEFLARVREIDDRAIRMLVTAYGDAETLGSAINDGKIYRYVAKPWNPDEMRLTLLRAIERYALDRERDTLLNELTLLNRLSRTLHRELDPDRVVDHLVDVAHTQLGFNGASVLLFSGDRKLLTWAGIAPDEDVAARVRGVQLLRSRAPNFFETLEEGSTQTLAVEDLESLEGPVRDWVAEVSADQIVVVPLVGKTEVIGALAIDNRRGGRRFGADDRTLLDGLSTQAVIALENARTVADLRSSRAQVQRVDRLGTLGTLAAGLAHEINNPLVSIHTFLSLAPEKRDAASEDNFWTDYHALASSELERIRGLVGTMQQLGRGDEERPSPAEVDLGQLARDVVQLLEREAVAKGVTLESDVGDDVTKVVGVHAQLHQVLLNLVMNALHATPAQGRVSLCVTPAPDASGGAVVEVRDTGSGIDPENLERIFDPFFTTKDPDQGTGLGLMISHQIVLAHGGSIELESSKDAGSCFRVRRPRGVGLA
ncbi:MAG: ATP-binding protein [Myxococcota bacterium]|nr:ATP-binding protein [Myxococcota bacterium]